MLCMAEFSDALSEKHIAFIRRQPVFFTATAAESGRINLSPKGLDTFRVLSPDHVGYLDLGGSGNETHAHLAADGRITIMFCGFETRLTSCESMAAAAPCCHRTRTGTRWRRSSRY